MKTLEFHPLAEPFPLLPEAELKSLAEGIMEQGQQIPICLFEGKILDGRNRYLACKLVNVKPIFETYNGDNPLAHVIQLNLKRRHMNESQRAMVAARLANMEQGARTDLKPSANLRKVDQPTAARLLNVSERSVQTAKSILRESPKNAAAIDAGKKTLNQVQQETKQEMKRALAKELNAQPIPTPTGQFNVIVIDPPWKYEKRVEDTTHRARLSYPEMTTDEICALPVPKLSERDCVLWLWTTNAFMRDAFRCLDTWGFQEKTILTWGKQKMGCGDWLRGKTEHCLMAVKGKPIVTLSNQTTLLLADAREHSRKPDEFFTLVESLCPGSKLEMFSRQQRKGWQLWGLETCKF